VTTLAAGCVMTQPSPARLSVHVDRLAPDKVQAFEAARLRFVGVLRQKGKSDRRGLFLKVGDSTYYSVITFGAWRDLDRLRHDRARAEKAVGKEEAAAYHRDSDAALVFPHASEIWVAQPEVSYVPTGRRLPDAVQLVIEDVKPTAEEAYEAAWKQIARALTEAKYPVERRTYFSAYGTGRMLSFWLAPSPAVVKTAPTLQQALTSVLGADKAHALLEAWRAAVQGSQTLDVEAELEMSSD
jgi:hypothetical protein